MKWIVLFLCSAIVLTAHAQTNLVKNGDFREVEGDYLASIKYLNEEHTGIKDWRSISTWGGQAVSASENIEKIYTDWSVQETAFLRDSIESKNKTLVRVLTMRFTDEKPFSREYLAGKLKQKLKRGKKYLISLNLYLPRAGCYNLTHFGFRLQTFPPKSYLKSIREDNNAIHFKISQQKIDWIECDTTIIAKGGEEYILLGCFLPKGSLKYYQYFPDKYFETKNPDITNFTPLRRKKKCPEKHGIAISVSHVSVIALEPETARLSSGVVEEQQAVLEEKVAKEPIQKEWKYTLYFEENSTVPKEKELDSLLLELSQLDTTQTTYSISLTGYADQEGSTKNMLKLSQKRTKSVCKVLQKKQLKYLKDINQNARGNQGIISVNAAKNRRVEVVIKKE